MGILGAILSLLDSAGDDEEQELVALAADAGTTVEDYLRTQEELENNWAAEYDRARRRNEKND